MRASALPWHVEHHRGRASAFHARAVPEPYRRSLWFFQVTAPAVVLGSTQRLAVIEAASAARAGAEVVRRRSGGGAVWMAPGALAWVDVVLPAADPLAETDVSRSARWLGEAWARTLARLGVDGAEVHTGPMVRTPWSDLVCFGGLAPGEVTVDGAKVLGISQRRTRAGARFQCAVLQHWAPDPLVEVLALDDGQRRAARRDLAASAMGLDDLVATPVDAARLAAAFGAELSQLR